MTGEEGGEDIAQSIGCLWKFSPKTSLELGATGPRPEAFYKIKKRKFLLTPIVIIIIVL